MSRPTRCPWCGVRIAAAGAVTCTSCRLIDLRKGYTQADALTGGRWVNDGGIQRWEEEW